MTAPKERVTITVDRDLVAEGQAAIDAGEADSMSGWVNTALREKVARDRKRRELAAVIADYEAEFGKITDEEINSVGRTDRASAIVVRGDT